MLVLIRYKGEERFKVLEAHSLECIPYPDVDRVVVELQTPIGGVVLEVDAEEEGAERLAKRILNDLLSENRYVVQVTITNVFRERWRE